MRFKNYINRYNKKNRIYSEEELLAMTLNELLNNESLIMAQDSDIGIPSYEELRKSPNTRWIDSFINKDGQKDGGFFGSILENDFGDYTKPKQNVFDSIKPFAEQHPEPIIMKDEFPTGVIYEDEEAPYVLEGGVEENVYKEPEEEEEEDTQAYPSPEPTNSKPKTTQIEDLDIAELLNSLFNNNSSEEDEFLPVPKIPDNPKPYSENDFTFQEYVKNVPALQNNKELEEIFKRLVEELKKYYRTNRTFRNIQNNFLYGSLPNNNKLSFWEVVKEISALKPRQNQKAEIDEYLNDYVKRKNIPDEYKNALRHRAGSLLMAKKLGDNDKAQLWGNIKEFLDLLSGHDSKAGSAIDAQNNYIGRTLYDKYKNDNLSDDELMEKIIDSIKRYNPDEINFKEWQNKDSKIPMNKIFESTNTISRPINKKYHKIEKALKNNTKT